MKDIRLYNTKTRQVELFKPIKENTVGIYSCGPTVYHYVHLGNLRACIFADTLHRMFVQSGYTVNHVMNITDVGHLVSDGDDGEDKLEKGSKREGKTAWEVAKYYSDEFFKDIISLNINTSEYSYPRATDNIQEQIDLIQSLSEKGYTYIISDGVYFDTSKFPTYGDFAQLDIEGLKSGARVAENGEKKNITDFALWKFSPKDEKRDMEWDSPWGKGFPGWHIECSAMSKKILGSHFDIHTGGIDHIPVHHTNEIAQSECANNEAYVNYWMHNNFLNDASGKMAKSNGDFLRRQTILDKNISPLAFRYYLLTAHYRAELTFSFEALTGAAQAYNKLIAWCANNKTSDGIVLESYSEKFLGALYDDLSTPACIATLWELQKDDTISKADKYMTLTHLADILGLPLKDANQKETEEVTDPLALRLLQERKDAKLAKDFAKADELRKEIEDLGYTITDSQTGHSVLTRWEKE